MIEPTIRMTIDPQDLDPNAARAVIKKTLERLEQAPAHEHDFVFLRQERKKASDEIQDVLYCRRRSQFRFRPVGEFRPVGSW